MTNTEKMTAPDVIDLREPTAEVRTTDDRETTLRRLLDPPLQAGEAMDYEHCPNYEFARDSGLLDAFYYNPETGEDGVEHLLAGAVINRGETEEVVGYHHEASALESETYVDTAPLEGKNSKALRDFRRFQFEPYSAHVVIKGYEKMHIKRLHDGSTKVERGKSSMFPGEYDALAVLRAAVIARDTRDRSLDERRPNAAILATGKVPLLDGEASMPIKLVLHADTEQVITAMPLPSRTGYMQLEPEDVTRHLGLNNQ